MTAQPTTRSTIPTEPPAGGGEIVPFPISMARPRVTLSQPIDDWVETVRQRLNYLCALQPGWDGYAGQPTRFDIAYFAFELLRRICQHATPAPSIVPLPSGGLQIEWHRTNADIELTIQQPNEVEAWVADPAHQDDGVDKVLDTDFAFILPWVEKLG